MAWYDWLTNTPTASDGGAYAPNRLSVLGATLKDIGAAASGGEGNALSSLSELQSKSALAAMDQRYRQDMLGMKQKELDMSTANLRAQAKMELASIAERAPKDPKKRAKYFKKNLPVLQAQYGEYLGNDFDFAGELSRLADEFQASRTPLDFGWISEAAERAIAPTGGQVPRVGSSPLEQGLMNAVAPVARGVGQYTQGMLGPQSPLGLVRNAYRAGDNLVDAYTAMQRFLQKGRLR